MRGPLFEGVLGQTVFDTFMSLARRVTSLEGMLSELSSEIDGTLRQLEQVRGDDLVRGTLLIKLGELHIQRHKLRKMESG